MLDISTRTKNAFRGDSYNKQMEITIESFGTFTNEQIYYESFELRESLINSNDMSFVGCIASEMIVTIRAESVTMRESVYNGSKITVRVRPQYRDDTYGDWVPLFYGFIENGEMSNDRSYLKLTCYDAFHFLGSINVWDWYRTVAFYKSSVNHNREAKTLRYLLESLADYVDVNTPYGFELEENTPIILEDVKIKKRLKNKKMTALDFIKSYCQLAGACGVMSREGKLKFVYMSDGSIVDLDTYPGANTFPGANTYPGTSSSTQGGYESLQYYRSAASKDYYVRPFAEGMTIRTNDDDNGVTLAAPDPEAVDWDDDSQDTYNIDDNDVAITTGKYILKGNGLVKKLSAKKRRGIINLVLAKTQAHGNDDYTFKSHDISCNGLPFVEVGDSITIPSPPGSTSPIARFIVCNRTIKGIQSMVDNYKLDIPETIESYGATDHLDTEANTVDEDTVKEISDQSAKDYTDNYTYDKATIDQKVGGLSGLDILVVDSFTGGVLTTHTYTVP